METIIIPQESAWKTRLVEGSLPDRSFELWIESQQSLRLFRVNGKRRFSEFAHDADVLITHFLLTFRQSPRWTVWHLPPSLGAALDSA